MLRPANSAVPTVAVGTAVPFLFLSALAII
jgi:hypothetical protein